MSLQKSQSPVGQEILNEREQDELSAPLSLENVWMSPKISRRKSGIILRFSKTVLFMKRIQTWVVRVCQCMDV